MIAVKAMIQAAIIQIAMAFAIKTMVIKVIATRRNLTGLSVSRQCMIKENPVTRWLAPVFATVAWGMMMSV